MPIFERRIIGAVLVLLASIGLGIATASAAAGVGGGSGFTPWQTAAIDATVDQVMAEQRIPGVSLGIYAPGSRYEATYGVADLVTDEPTDAADTVRIASISKTYTAVAVLRLIDRGKLRLRDRLAEYVRGVPNGRRITIRQLLAMTAGIYDFTRDEQFNAAFSADPLYPTWKPRDLFEILDRHEPDFRPGKMVSYSDSNYILLGMIIEKVTGRSARKVINRLATRAGLSDTSFPRSPRMPAPFAHGYYAGDDGDGPLLDYTAVNPDVPWTAGAMLSNRRDLRRWSRQLGRGKLLSKRLFKKQTQIRPIPNPGGPAVGYGLGLFKLADWIGHNGAIYGFNTVMLYLPEERATIVLIANKSTNFSSETLDMFFPIAAELYPGSVAVGDRRTPDSG